MLLAEEAGVPLAESQADMTPIQRFVYFTAKDEHTPDEVKDAAGMDEGTEVLNNSRYGRRNTPSI